MILFFFLIIFSSVILNKEIVKLTSFEFIQEYLLSNSIWYKDFSSKYTHNLHFLLIFPVSYTCLKSSVALSYLFILKIISLFSSVK